MLSKNKGSSFLVTVTEVIGVYNLHIIYYSIIK